MGLATEASICCFSFVVMWVELLGVVLGELTGVVLAGPLDGNLVTSGCVFPIYVSGKKIRFDFLEHNGSTRHLTSLYNFSV